MLLLVHGKATRDIDIRYRPNNKLVPKETPPPPPVFWVAEFFPIPYPQLTSRKVLKFLPSKKKGVGGWVFFRSDDRLALQRPAATYIRRNTPRLSRVDLAVIPSPPHPPICVGISGPRNSPYINFIFHTPEFLGPNTKLIPKETPPPSCFLVFRIFPHPISPIKGQ